MENTQQQAKEIVNQFYQPLTIGLPELAAFKSSKDLWEAAKEMAIYNTKKEIEILNDILNEIPNV